MKTFIDAESVEGSIKMLALIIEEGGRWYQKNFSMSLKKVWLRKKKIPIRVCPGKEGKKKTQKTIANFKALKNTLILLLGRKCSGLKTQLSFRHLLITFIVICI